MEEKGYEVRPVVFPSCSLGTRHKRERLWVLCYSKYNGLNASKKHGITNKGSFDFKERQKEPFKFERPNTSHEAMEGITGAWIYKNSFQAEWFSIEPEIRRMVHGSSDFVDRLKMLGNGQVPACTYVIGKMIVEIENEN